MVFLHFREIGGAYQKKKKTLGGENFVFPPTMTEGGSKVTLSECYTDYGEQVQATKTSMGNAEPSDSLSF